MENASDWVPPRADTKHNEELDAGDLAESRSAYLSQEHDGRQTDRQERTEEGPCVTLPSPEAVIPDLYFFWHPSIFLHFSIFKILLTQS